MHLFSARVIESRDIGGGYSWLRLGACAPLQAARPGQFVMLRGPWDRDPLLPRAYSIQAVGDDEARFLVRRVGRGSCLLGDAAAGSEVSVLGPLGTSFPETETAQDDLLVAGGCGLAPLHFAACRAAARGQSAHVALLVGARRQAELAQPLLDGVVELGVRVQTITEDGSAGEQGLVTELLARRLARRGERVRVLACGPEPMLRAVRELARQAAVPCYLSLESAMACGLGLCLGCATPGAHSHYLHVCQDGPVFAAEEVWP